MAVYAFIFPGQGSQTVGMGQEIANAFPVARAVFEEIDDSLNTHLSKIIFNGPIKELTITENTQPALMAVSIAVLRALEHEGNLDISKIVTVLAGHSLGEYTALTAGKALILPEAARLLRLRGQAMQHAVPLGEGGMIALVGASLEQAEALCTSCGGEGSLEIANDNGGGQIVLSGKMACLEKAISIAKEMQIKRTIMLPVSAPFHSSLMESAKDVMAKALAQAHLDSPVVPLISNVTATCENDIDVIRQNLVRQVVSRVRWRESIDEMVRMGVDTFVEVGSGKVLSNIIKRIVPTASTFHIGTPTDIEYFLQSLG